MHIDDGEYEASKDLVYIHMAHLVHSPISLIHGLLERQCGAPMFYFAASARGISYCNFLFRFDLGNIHFSRPF